ncbi:unnamed protein product [Paramecium sonneborni]|uniref:Uncharacterized protein n=1 Tax=Paramecium sonneborni TaxID=65129 RepID=A0A8S1M6U4_9CILI|nr:unnamed protein product [Paramecium sonneborni]
MNFRSFISAFLQGENIAFASINYSAYLGTLIFGFFGSQIKNKKIFQKNKLLWKKFAKQNKSRNIYSKLHYIIDQTINTECQFDNESQLLFLDEGFLLKLEIY